MAEKDRNTEPIELRLKLMATPVAAFRAITSQTELRRWWAPRVIMSRNVVSQETGRDMEMRLVSSEANHLVRYSWRGLDWPRSIPSTVIAFEIEDRGVSRGSTGEGIVLHILHDGWTNPEERERQVTIWKSAVECLEKHLHGKAFKSWWDEVKVQDGFRQIQFQSVQQFIERMERESKGKAERKLAIANILSLCEELADHGSWFMKDNGNEMELRLSGIRILGIMKNGSIIIGWRDLEKILGDRLPDFASRMTAEQDVDLHIGKSQDKIPAQMINPVFLNRWYLDIIRFHRGKQ